jgi:hypothetical protein
MGARVGLMTHFGERPFFATIEEAVAAFLATTPTRVNIG